MYHSVYYKEPQTSYSVDKPAQHHNGVSIPGETNRNMNLNHVRN